MKRNRGPVILTVAMALPCLWLAATGPWSGGSEAWALGAGSLVTGAMLIALLWRFHRAGKMLAHRCLTCENPMVRTQPGELRPPDGATTLQTQWWRCRRCGRLV